ncbi:ATP-dependent helicase [Geofilum rhodophaeum]|uniref:ATP-dependent helicase n=1 Tax=Geofilum rhodophaeum TaxID=1965019 RepID=UPI000B51F9A7|nr:UvrD-helicase domain-containing protein [Geofilum rhodophaeum]
MQDYLDQLNEAQRSAVTTIDGPTLVVAGAGSGKTRVLTYRIAYLLQQGVPPWRVLALTFTNKAAREMKERIAALTGKEVASRLWMGTFHSVFARILRVEAEHLNFPSSFTIYDTADSKSLIKSILKELQITDKEYKPGLILSRISAAKNDLVLPAAYARDTHRLAADKAAKVPMVYEIYLRYLRACLQAGAMDFDDLLLNTNLLFRDHPEVLAKYQEQFRYVLVDEYQDTNFSQYLIVRKLAEQHKNVCVVGDDAQSIYSFRGAKIENILNFRNDYPGYHLFKLEQNYRSTRNIVNAANSIIANNKGQIPKVVFSDKEEGEKLKVLQAYSDVEEGYMVVKELQNRRLNATCAYADFAILYRTNAQSRIFEEALRKNNVPYRMYGGLSFYQRKEIKDLLAYLRMVINPRDGEALKRIINYPARGIGKTTMDRLEKAAADNQMSLWEVLTHPELGRVGFNAGTLKKLGAFVQLIRSFERLLPVMNAYELTTEVVAQSGILKDLHQDKSTEGQTRIENLDELLNGVREFTEERIESGEDNKLVDFLEEVALLTDMDQGDSEDTDRVTLMTIHSAKGLEFPYVFIAGVEEGLFPSPMSGNSEQGLEEERRLFYVAVTRAEKQVTLSYARSRFKYGEHNFVTPSRFLKDIDTAYLEGVETAAVGRSATAPGGRFKRKADSDNGSIATKRSFSFREESPVRKPAFSSETFAGTGGDIVVGSRVAHERFGQGEVMALEGQAPNLKAMIAFDNAGTKQLLLKFAKLRLLS